MAARPRRFHLAVPQAALDDLLSRVARTRWADPPTSDGWEQGVPPAHLRAQVRSWLTDHDWRAWEARLNRFEQYTTSIDGQQVHFLHIRSPEPEALPLVLTHGWPGSVFDLLPLAAPLTDPRSCGGEPRDAFHLVVPSLPGFPFSGPTTEPGWGVCRIARAWVSLMDRLGYPRYGAVGDGWGSEVSLTLGSLEPTRVAGVHVSRIASCPGGREPEEIAGMSGTDLLAVEAACWSADNREGYRDVQAQQPQTVAYALADSPVGLLAWFDQIYRGVLDDDLVLATVEAYWLTGTVASSLRLFHEVAGSARPPARTTVPIGLARFPDADPSNRSDAERHHADIVAWNDHGDGDGFAAHTAPATLVADIRALFRELR